MQEIIDYDVNEAITKTNVKINCNIEKIKYFMSYNIYGGKKTRAKLFKFILSEHKCDIKTNFFEFLIELFQAALLVADDIMDKAELRRGQTCFYKINGMKSMKNVFYMLSFMHKNFDKRCKKLYHDCLFITCVGQVLDAKEKKREEYSPYLYSKICDYKTAYYSIFFPMACGYLIMNKPVPKWFEEICYKIGYIFQMQDDYLNFHVETSKKSATDLEDRKLTWFTSKLQNDNDPDIVIFYKDGTITEKLREKIQFLMKDYEVEIYNLVDELYKEMEDKGLSFLKTVVKMFIIPRK